VAAIGRPSDRGGNSFSCGDAALAPSGRGLAFARNEQMTGGEIVKALSLRPFGAPPSQREAWVRWISIFADELAPTIKKGGETPPLR